MDIERWLRVCEQYDAALVWAPTSEFPGGWPALSVPSVLEGLLMPSAAYLAVGGRSEAGPRPVILLGLTDCPPRSVASTSSPRGCAPATFRRDRCQPSPLPTPTRQPPSSTRASRSLTPDAPSFLLAQPIDASTIDVGALDLVKALVRRSNVQLCRQGIEAFRRIFTPTHPRPDPSLPSSTPSGSLPEGVGAVDGTPRRLVETALERLLRSAYGDGRVVAARRRVGTDADLAMVMVSLAHILMEERGSWLRSKAQAAVDAAKAKATTTTTISPSRATLPTATTISPGGATLPSPRRRVLSVFDPRRAEGV